MYNSNDNMNDYSNTNHNSNNTIKKRKIFKICFLSFYGLCLVFIIIGIVSWWNNKEKFYLTTNEISMITNSEYQIKLYGKTEAKKVSSYNYISSNPDIVTVDDNGVIHSKSEGEAQITVKSKYSSKSNVIDVMVEGDSFYSVAFGTDRINVDLNEKVELKPVVNNDPNFKTDLVWKSSDNRIVAVNNKGVITGKKPGAAYVTVGIKNTRISSRIKILVSSSKYVQTGTSQPNNNLPKIISEDTTDNGEKDINTYIGVVDVESSINNTTVGVGRILKANYKVTPTNATNKKVTWSSSDESVATVNSLGVIRTLSAGTTDISVKTQDGNKTSFFTLNVVSSTSDKTTIELNKKQVFMKAGYTEQLVAIVNKENMGVKWSSSRPNVAVVDNDGKIVSKSMGNTVIKAVTADGKVQAMCNVFVVNSNILVQKITLNKYNLALNRGAIFQLRYAVYPNNSTNQALTYSSSNPSVATVDTKGKVVGVGLGKAVISVSSSNGIVATCTVVVSNLKIKALNVKKSSIQLFKGKGYRIKVSINPRKASNQALLYKSKNPKIASVDSNGLITGVGLGTTTIIVKAQDGSGKFAKIKVVVVPNVSIIIVKKSNYKTYYKNVENYITTKYSKHMQNFAIQNLGSKNEILYLSGVTAGNTEDPMTKETRANLSRTLIVRIPKKTVKTGAKKRSVMHLKETGHGQSFDLENNGVVWTNAKAVEPYFASDRWWGQHKGAMRINFKQNGRDSNFSSLATIYPKDPSTGKPYIGLDVSVDEDNDLLATRSGKKVMVFKLSAAKKSRMVKLYEFEVENTDTYRQGEDIKGGFYYLLLGEAGNKMRIEVYDMLGNLKYAKGFYAASKKVSVKKEVEPEGLKVYGNKIFVGLTHNKNARDVWFDVGYLR